MVSGVIATVILSGCMAGDVATSINVDATGGNILGGDSHPIGVDNNYLVIVCGNGTGDTRYLFWVVVPGLVIIPKWRMYYW